MLLVVFRAPLPERTGGAFVVLDFSVLLAAEHARIERSSEGLFVFEDCTHNEVHLFLTVPQLGWIGHVVAILCAGTVDFVVLLAEVVQQEFATTHGRLSICHHFLKELGPNLLFSQRLPLKELFQFLNIPVTVKGNAMAFTTVSSGATLSLGNSSPKTSACRSE